MTDKQIIINCKYKFQNNEKFEGKPYCTLHNELCEDLSFVCDDNCQIYEDYKQLKRKEQECDELRVINDRYHKALEKIEEVAKNIDSYMKIGCDMDKCEDCNHFKPFCTNQCVCFLISQGAKILNIINKVKGEENDLHT